MKRKIIIQSGNISIGGQEKMSMEFLNILDKEKYDVLFLIEEDKGVKNDYINDIPKWINYKFLTSKEFMKKLEEYKESKNIFKKLMYSLMLKRKKKISIENLKKYMSFSDIIIDYNMGLLRFAHKLDLRDKKFVAWCHAGNGGLPKNKQKRENIKKYTHFVTINEEMKKGFEKSCNGSQVVKIYNFMDFEKIEQKSEEAIEEKIENFIVSVGSLTENKNQKLLIEAFSEGKKEGKIKEKLLILGEGKEREKLQEKIKELGMEKEIYLLGQKQNPYKYIKKSKLFILSSINEGMPLTVLEAMSLKKMIICTENNGTREILGESEFGKLVKNNDKRELKESLVFYLENDEEREKVAKLGYERSKVFSKEKIKKEIEEFIDNL